MTRRSNRLLYWLVAVAAWIFSTQAIPGDLCPQLLNRQMFSQSGIVFLAQVIDARLVRAASQPENPGRIVANFEVIETYKGNPAEVTRLVSYLQPDGPLEPVYSMRVGWPALVFAEHGGDYVFDVCTAHRARILDECEIYELQSLAGIGHREDRNCEAAIMHARFRERGVRSPSVQWDDLEGLRSAWKAQFDEDP